MSVIVQLNQIPLNEGQGLALTLCVSLGVNKPTLFPVYCSIINLLWSLMSKMSTTFRSVSYGPCSCTGVTCVASDLPNILGTMNNVVTFVPSVCFPVSLPRLLPCRLLSSEREGKLCRDETVEGLRFYPNWLLTRA